MDAMVKLLREQGRRKPIDTVNAERGALGRLVLATGGAGCELRLASYDDRCHEPLLPVLYDVRLLTLHGATMLFRGVERDAAGTEYVQEWSARVALAASQGQLFVAEDGR
jgi:hypothetical protein